MHAFIAGAMRQLDATVHIVGGVEDHVHILVGLKSSHAVADIIRETKKASNKWATTNHDRGFAWQIGYGAFTFGKSDLNRLKKYVLEQEEHHKRISSADELRALLEQEGIEFDPRFFE